MKSPLWRYALRLTLNSFVYSALTFLLYLGIITKWPDLGGVAIAVAIVSAVMSIVYIYSISWKTGERDRNLVKFGHLTYQPLRGLWAGLVSAVPLLLTWVQTWQLTSTPVKVISFAGIVGLVAMATVSYQLGHKLVSMSFRLFYKKKKSNSK